MRVKSRLTSRGSVDKLVIFRLYFENTDFGSRMAVAPDLFLI